MRARLLTVWSELIESFWLVPALMAVLAAVIAVGAVALDRAADDTLAGNFWIWSGGADGARSLLSTIASSMITVAGTVFSITIAALTLASQQFGPRLLRNFTADRGNQVVLGTFISTFVYCLMVTRTVRSQAEGHFVPNIAVSFGVVLACASLGVLIYYIHHIASSIQAEHLLAAVGRDFKAELKRLIPPTKPGAGPDHRDAQRPTGTPRSISATSSGYIQLVDRDALVAIGDDGDLFIELLHRPGDFVSCREPLFQVWTGQRAVSDQLGTKLCNAVHVGPRRTSLQDTRYGLRQLSEIGARALSPGINDPFTAMGCIDWLTDGLSEIGGTDPASGLRRNDTGVKRLLEHPLAFADLLRLGFEPLRIYGSDSLLVVVHMLKALQLLATVSAAPASHRALREEAELTIGAAEAGLTTETDRAAAARAFAAVCAALEPIRETRASQGVRA